MPKKYLLDCKCPNAILQKNSNVISEKEYLSLTAKIQKYYSPYKSIVVEDFESDFDNEVDFTDLNLEE